VTATDTVDATLSLMMDHAFEAARVKAGSFDSAPRQLRQWKALLNVIKIGDLVMSLRRDPAKNTRDQFIEKMALISKRMPANGRAIFVIDPEKTMQKESDQSWAIIVRDLPEKIKLVFAQRSEDVLVDSGPIKKLKNVVRIPDDGLGVLDEEAIEQLVNDRAGKLRHSYKELRGAIARYQGHPYAVAAALDLIEDGLEIAKLPVDPTPEGIVKEQCRRAFDKGADAVRLLESHAVLEVGVPDEVVRAVSGLDAAERKTLMADSYISKLLRTEGAGKRIYHAILADYVLEEMAKDERGKYHESAIVFYRAKLKDAKERQSKPDELAALRLSAHVLAHQGSEAFVYAFVNECASALMDIGSFDAFIGLSIRTLEVVKEGTGACAILLGNLGIIYKNRGDLDVAERMHRKALEINEKLGRLEGMARVYGNLGTVFLELGDLDHAEQMHRTALEMAERLGSPRMITEIKTLLDELR